MKKQAAPRAPYPPAPEHLSERSRGLWTELGPTRARSVGRRVLFEQALTALDSADDARRIVQAEGLISATKTTGALHVHPAAKIERESRQQFIKAWDLLGLRFYHDFTG